jgi:hypothetical protein
LFGHSCNRFTLYSRQPHKQSFSGVKSEENNLQGKDTVVPVCKEELVQDTAVLSSLYSSMNETMKIYGEVKYSSTYCDTLDSVAFFMVVGGGGREMLFIIRCTLDLVTGFQEKSIYIYITMGITNIKA